MRAELRHGYLAGLLILTLGSFAAVLHAEGGWLQVNPNALLFTQIGQRAPAPQQLTLIAHGGVVTWFTVLAATADGGNWLQVSPSSGNANVPLSVSVNATGLADGEYTGYLIVNASGFLDHAPRVKIVLRVVTPAAAGSALHPALIARPHDLNFRAITAGAPPDSQLLTVADQSGSTLEFTISAANDDGTTSNWLTASVAIMQPRPVIRVAANPAGLAAGSYRAHVGIQSSSGTARVPVTLDVVDAPAPGIAVTPSGVGFTVDSTNGTLPQVRDLKVVNPLSGSSWTASVQMLSPATGAWLAAAPVSPGILRLTANPANREAGVYAARVTVTNGQTSRDVPVFLRVLGTDRPAASVSPKALLFGMAGTLPSPAQQALTVDAAIPGRSYSASVIYGSAGDWLSVTPATGTAPANLQLSVTSGAVSLAPGVYTAIVEVRIPGAAQEVHDVHVSLRVPVGTETPALVPDRGSMSFAVGSAPPAAQWLTLFPMVRTSLNWTARAATFSGGDWLKLSHDSGTATAASPSQLAVSVAPGAQAPGLYRGTIVFAPADDDGAPPLLVDVTMTIGAVVSVMASEPAAVIPPLASAAFTAPADGFAASQQLPIPVEVCVLDAQGQALRGAAVTVHSSNGEPDVVLDETRPGLYRGLVKPLAAGTLTLYAMAETPVGTTAMAVVSGGVEGGAPRAVLFAGGVVNAASFAPAPTPLAPGSLFSIFGANLAGSAGGVATLLPLPVIMGGVSVSLGGYPVPLLSVTGGGAGQINGQVPFELAGIGQADLVVNNNGFLAAPEPVWLVSAAPALFTANQRGDGAAAAFHADYTPVNAGHPAAGREVVLFFGTGLGAVRPAINSGQASDEATPISAPAAVSIGAAAANVLYIGLAPGYAGLYQINVEIPDNLPAGDQPVSVTVGGVPGVLQTTISVK